MTYQSKKLSSRFHVKNKTNFCHKNNLVYYGKCPNKNVTDDYVGKTDRRVEGRNIDHNKRDKNSNLLRHACEMQHHRLWHEDFRIIGSNYRPSFKRKFSKTFIKK